MKAIYLLFKDWHQRTNELAKLQTAYSVLAVGLLILAGLISLINARLGQTILFFAIWSLLLLLANGVLWALIETFVVKRLNDDSLSRRGASKNSPKKR